MKADLPTLAAPMMYTSLPLRSRSTALAASLMPSRVRLLTRHTAKVLRRFATAVSRSQSATARRLVPFGSRSTCEPDDGQEGTVL